ncbi:MAG: LptF/LptG family permease [Kiritimatiellae bacterium]|nr:LptF/LptG family permease [Kiritimatiellia bacterium]
MRILTRYVFREFLVPLFYCLCGFGSVYMLFELFGSFSRMAEAKPPFLLVVRYFTGYLAPFFQYLAPAALMLATLYTMWSFCRHSEIVAMRANGIGFLAIVKPLLFVAFAMACFVAWVDECYVPRTAQWAKQFRNARFDVEKVERADNVVFRNPEDDRIWSIDRLLDDDGRHLQDVRVTVNRPDGARLMNVTASRADYLDGEWWMTGTKVQHYDSSGRETASPTPELDALSFRPFPEFHESPADFVAQNRDWAYNSVSDRVRYLRQHPDLPDKIRRKYRYDIWSQMLAPLACLVITLFAIPAGVASGRQSVFKGVVGALVMFFAFYGLVIGCMVAADVGWVNPVVAACLPHVVFLTLGARLFYRQR